MIAVESSFHLPTLTSMLDVKLLFGGQPSLVVRPGCQIVASGSQPDGREFEFAGAEVEQVADVTPVETRLPLE